MMARFMLALLVMLAWLAPLQPALAKQDFLPPEKAYRYVRYLAPNGSFGNIAETSFIGF